MKYIPLTQGKYAIVDATNFEIVNQYKWHYHCSGYAARRGRLGESMVVYLHQMLLAYNHTTHQVDHINCNRLDNRCSNLRIVTRSQNCMNRNKQKTKTSSQYKGVYYCSTEDKWRSVIEFNNKKKHLGRFLTEIEAANAYNNAASELFGQYARLNVIEEENELCRK